MQPVTIWQRKEIMRRIQRRTEYANNMAVGIARHFSTELAKRTATIILCDRILARRLSEEKLYENSSYKPV